MIEEEKELELSAETSTEEETFTKLQVKSMIDSEISKAVNKYKETTYKKDLEVGISKALENRDKKTPEQIQISNLQKELESERNIRIEKERTVLRNSNLKTAMETLSSKGLPVEFADLIASDDSEKTTTELSKVMDVLDTIITKTKQQVIDGNNIRIPSKTKSGDSTTLPGENASKEEWKTWIKQNK